MTRRRLPMVDWRPTVDALVATGDLNRIHDDSLRAVITAYLDRTRSSLDPSMAIAHENSARIRERIREDAAELRRRIESELGE